jgi:uncharacterized protein (DUF58 family)
MKFSIFNSEFSILNWLSLGGALRITQPLMLALAPALFLLTLVAPYRWLYFLAYSFALLSLLCYAWVRYQAPRVRVTRRLEGDWAQVGDTLSEHWTATNRSFLPLLWMELEDESTVPGYTARRVAACGPFGAQQWTTKADCTRRGVYALGPLLLRLSDPFGVFEYRRAEQATRRIVVYPPLVRLPPVEVPRGQRGGLARADLLQQYATPSVGGLREYRPGDMPSHIHWPTVARRDQLMVKEFDQERAGAVWIVLDCWSGAFGAAGEQGLELAVVLAASLAARLIGEGRSVGFLTDDGRERRVPPGHGPRQLWAILGELVDVGATGSAPLGNVLRRVARGGALALITPDVGGAWLGALAEASGRSGALALLIARPGEAGAGATGALQRALATMGVAAQAFPADTELPRVNPPRPRDELRVGPLGRAVRVKARERRA